MAMPSHLGWLILLLLALPRPCHVEPQVKIPAGKSQIHENTKVWAMELVSTRQHSVWEPGQYFCAALFICILLASFGIIAKIYENICTTLGIVTLKYCG
jgi:hypothetical protein